MRIVDFLLVLIELFFARCYRWGISVENRQFHSNGDHLTQNCR